MQTLLILVLSFVSSAQSTRSTFFRFLKCFKGFYNIILYFVLLVYFYISVIFFLKATIRACHEPGVSCSESMFYCRTVLYLWFWTNNLLIYLLTKSVIYLSSPIPVLDQLQLEIAILGLFFQSQDFGIEKQSGIAGFRYPWIAIASFSEAMAPIYDTKTGFANLRKPRIITVSLSKLHKMPSASSLPSIYMPSLVETGLHTATQ